ncbi:MAG: translocation/assembly module TamB domain-containing protein [Chitinophagales bacterium]
MAINAKNIIKKTAKVMGFALLLLLVLLLLLKLPYVQTQLAKTALKFVSKKTNATIKLDKLSINFVDKVGLEGLYIEDLNKDTLLYTQNLDVNMSILHLLKGKIYIDKVLLNNTVANIYQQHDSTFNFQFLIDAFAGDTTQKTKSNIDFDISEVQLQNFKIDFNLLSGKNQFIAKNLSVKTNKIDINKLIFSINYINIEQLNGFSIWQNNEMPADTLLNDIPTSFPFDGFPVSINVDELKIKESNFKYQLGNDTSNQKFNANYINVKDINLWANNIVVDSLGVEVEVNKLSSNLNNKINIEDLTTSVLFKPQNITVEELNLKTDYTNVQLYTKISYQNFDELASFSPNLLLDVDAANVNISLNELAYFVPQLDSFLQKDFVANNSVLVSGKINGKVNNIDLNNLKLTTANNEIIANGNLENLLDINKLNTKGLELSANIFAKDLQQILGENIIKNNYLKFGNIKLKTTVNGSLQSLNIANLSLLSAKNIDLKCQGKVNNLLNTEKLNYDFNIAKFNTTVSTIGIFVDSLPQQLDSIKLISYKGVLKGDLHRYFTNGLLETNIGKAQTKLGIAFNPNYSNAKYKGFISVSDLNLGILANSDSLGTINADITLDGKGLSLDSLNSNVEGEIHDITFNGYTYENILVLGEVANNTFNGKLNIDDNNLNFNFDGLVDFSTAIPKVDFRAELNKINTQNLNLTNFPIMGNLNIDANFTGLKPQDLDGNLKITNINISNKKDKWEMDSLVLKADKGEQGNTSYFVSSEIINGSLTGKYDIKNIGQIILTSLDKHYPFSSIFMEKDSSNFALSDEEIHLELMVNDATKLLEIFKVPISKLEQTTLSFDLNAQNESMDMILNIPEVKYQSYTIQNINLNSQSTQNSFNNLLGIDSVILGDWGYLPKLNLKADFNNNTGTSSLNIGAKQNLFLSSNFFTENNNAVFSVNSPIILGTENWQFSQSNPFYIKQIMEKLPTIKFYKDNQSIGVSVADKKLNLSFADFNINNIEKIIEFETLKLYGLTNGNVSLSMDSIKTIEGNLALNTLQINDIDAGDLKLSANILEDKVQANISLIGYDNDLQTNATYDINTGAINAEAKINKFQLATIEPFVQSYAKDISGKMTGNVMITGNLENLETNGQLSLSNVSAFAIPIGSSYKISSGKLNIATKEIHPEIILIDDKNRFAYLKGTVWHKSYKDFTYDLNFSADEFTFLNSKKTKDIPFYGNFVAKALLNIAGDTELPKISGSIEAKNSNLTVQLLDEQAVAKQEEYVIFMDGSDYSATQMDSIAEMSYKISTAVDLNLRVVLNENANIVVVIDPLTGDNLAFNGNGDLSVKMPPFKDLDITGVYKINQGNYRFSFQNVIKKNFNITQNSKITFTGNPENALLDITALYKTKATTLGLVESENTALSEADASEYKRKTDVNVYLKINGNLLNPELNFDIELPNSASNSINNSAVQALNKIKNNPNELNKQVFSLLLFNNFSTRSSSTSNITSAGTSNAVRSLSGMISNQLNKLASNAKGLELNLAVDQYKNSINENGEQITDIELGVSQSLLDDRLTISVDGNVGLESGQEKGALSNVAGNFEIRYKITQDGKLNIRVFQKSDYDALNESNVWKTGAGFSYQTNFGKILKKKK